MVTQSGEPVELFFTPGSVGDVELKDKQNAITNSEYSDNRW